MNFNEALAILKKDEEEERNWRSARCKLTDVLSAALAADMALEPVTKQQRALESDVAALRATFAKLDQDYQALQKSYGQLDADYRTKQQALETTLSTTRADVTAAQTLKRETEEQLATITAKWHLKTRHASAH